MSLYVFGTLIVGTLGQIIALVGQYRGAKQIENSIRIVHQGFFLSLVLGLLFVLLSKKIAPVLFAFFNHDPLLLERESAYFSILSFSILLMSFRMSFASFFIGIGNSKIVTWSASGALFCNIPLTYLLVFGKFGFPKMGIEGAALATVISGLIPNLVLCTVFYSKKYRTEYRTGIIPRFEFPLFWKLLRYGLPAGIEGMINVMGFMFFTMVMYSYSSEIAAATTIVLNWDMVCFIPLLGISQAVSGQIGKYLGEQNKRKAMQIAYSALIMGWVYASMITLTYLSANEYLVRIFASEHVSGKESAVYSYAKSMLLISCLYFLFDSTYNILSGILKGAGDTVWVMLTSNCLMWTTASLVYFGKNHFQLSPLVSWWALTAMVFSLGLSFMIRFLGKKWLSLLMIEPQDNID
ncbi:MATE efflux family protein [Leptospira ryugenii]|uniref:Multidrug-efflux transporter n=1 Tax=Leptospira ryugenii TaxID=1917863 RepID=A0A2P2E0I4_9LEPT|nr:MATE efflux family protein [Leptospira ryugenii]